MEGIKRISSGSRLKRAASSTIKSNRGKRKLNRVRPSNLSSHTKIDSSEGLQSPPPLPQESSIIFQDYSSDDASPPEYADAPSLAASSQFGISSNDNHEESIIYLSSLNPFASHLNFLRQDGFVRSVRESSPTGPQTSQSLSLPSHVPGSGSNTPGIWLMEGESKGQGAFESLDSSSLQYMTDCMAMETSEAEPSLSANEEDGQAAGGQGLLLNRTHNYLSAFPVPTSLDRYRSLSILRQPNLGIHSEEFLISNFDQNTCGILSVRNGGRENPWRSIVLPMAYQSPALANALLSMSAYHATGQRKERHREMKCRAIELMSKSRRYLSKNLTNMPSDVALATSLILAFAESWDFDGSTGIAYLRGGKTLVKQALESLARNPPQQHAEIERIQFLCRTWLYMDVIARLTRLEEEGEERSEIDKNLWAKIDSIGPGEDVDPLMGCATTLFPIIGQVANLIREVRLAVDNSPAIVSRATQLKGKLEAWTPPQYFNTPEDPMCHIEHSIQTAEAYRWATLLYLHQAVPEIPSKSSAYLADKVLKLLATVPPESNTIIIQIFPLLAAGSEASEPETRTWVENRWSKMSSRMRIANIDRCWMLVQKVWTLRDAWKVDTASARQKNVVPSAGRPTISNATSHIGESALIDSDPVGSSMPSESWAMPQYDTTHFVGSNMHTANNVVSSPTQRLLSTFDQSLQLGMVMESPIVTGSFRRTRRTSTDIVEDLHFDLTVKGRLHWIGVMKALKWESKSITSCPVCKLAF